MQTFQILFFWWLPPHCGVLERMGRSQKDAFDGCLLQLLLS